MVDEGRGEMPGKNLPFLSRKEIFTSNKLEGALNFRCFWLLVFFWIVAKWKQREVWVRE